MRHRSFPAARAAVEAGYKSECNLDRLCSFLFVPALSVPETEMIFSISTGITDANENEIYRFPWEQGPCGFLGKRLEY